MSSLHHCLLCCCYLQGNKGGVGVRFNLYHSSLCFVNCHFAASMEEVEKRNNVRPSHPHTLTPSHPHTSHTQDYHTIKNKMIFSRVPDYKYTIMEHE